MIKMIVVLGIMAWISTKKYFNKNYVRDIEEQP